MKTVKKQTTQSGKIYPIDYQEFKNRARWLYRGRATTIIPCLLVYILIATYGNFLPDLRGLLTVIVIELLLYCPVDPVLKKFYSLKKENLFFVMVLSIDVLATTAALHFGGIQDAMFFGAIYLITILFAGVFTTSLITYFIATFAAFCFGLLNLLEYLGIIPHISTIGITFTGREQTAWVASHVVFFYITAYLTTLYTNPIKKRGIDLYLWGKSLERRLNKTHVEAIKALMNALKVKDPYTESHSYNVAWYASLLTGEFRLDEQTANDIRDACFLHDIGKIGIKDRILSKRSGLTPQEWAQVKHHPAFGSAIITALSGTESVAKMIIQEHEHYDGSGYPLGLKGDQICLGAQIIAVCDAFDVLVTGRHYQKRLSLEKAIAVIEAGKGKEFAPMVVEKFMKVFNENKDKLNTFISQHINAKSG